MAVVVWQPWKKMRCERVGEEVILEVQRVYGADIMPEQPPRVVAHRCSHSLTCNMMDRPSCTWAGTLPGYDPLR